ncbi:MAG: hypothetical protein ACYDC3_16570 [Candidatus Binataceae bacterium]
MDSGKGWLAIAPVAGAIARFSGRDAYPCFLLEHGIPLATPHCAACGLAFDPPRRTGERFRAAIQVFEARGSADDHAPSTRLFVGAKVLVARAAPQFNLLLDRSITFVGARVMVASVRFPTGRYLPILLCRACGHNVTAHLSLDREGGYVWDWLVEFRPRRFLQRWGGRLIRRTSGYPSLQMRTSAHAS